MEAADTIQEMKDEAEANNKLNLAASIFMIVTAIFAIFAEFAAGDSGQDEMKFALKTMNAYAYSNIREVETQVSDVTVKILTVMLPIIPTENRSDTQDIIAAAKSDMAYNLDNHSGSEEYPNGRGKAQLQAYAREFNSEKEIAETRGDAFDDAKLIFGMAVVFASLAIMLRTWWMLLVGGIVACFGIFMIVDGFLLFWTPPNLVQIILGLIHTE